MMNKFETMNYPDFVALIGQENTPPGGAASVNYWINESKIDSNSRVLDLACTTGFSGRTAHSETNCSVVGIDLSFEAILAARARVQGTRPLKYYVRDACDLVGIGFFSHCLAGCNFAFIQEREKALEELTKYLDAGGYLCTANFHWHKKPTSELLSKMKGVLGWAPDSKWDLDYWNNFFSTSFNLENEEICQLEPDPESVLLNRLGRFMQSDHLTSKWSDEDLSQMHERLKADRLVLNGAREYQGYSKQIWKLR